MFVLLEHVSAEEARWPGEESELISAELKSVKCCFALKRDELNEPQRGGGGICDDGLSLSLGRAIAVEGELKERSEVSRRRSTKMVFPWQDVPDVVSAGLAFFPSRFSSPKKPLATLLIEQLILLS